MAIIMKIKESAEDYLENILVISQSKNNVRSIDIVKRMNLSKPSVSVAMKKLRENGYINMDSDGYITLTETGSTIAEKIYERHVFISQWLEELGVNIYIEPEKSIECLKEINLYF